MIAYKGDVPVAFDEPLLRGNAFYKAYRLSQMLVEGDTPVVVTSLQPFEDSLDGEIMGAGCREGVILATD